MENLKEKNESEKLYTPSERIFADRLINYNYSKDGRAIWTVDETPFALHKDNEETYYLTLGKYRLHDKPKSIEECFEWIDNITWKKLVDLFIAVQLSLNELKVLQNVES